MSHLGWTFFALSSSYSKYLLDEFYLLAKYLRTSYTEFNTIPTYVRKYLINKIVENNTKED
jgi:sulfur relay (sulfurtransferase) DsrC/TusE family protein